MGIDRIKGLISHKVPQNPTGHHRHISESTECLE